VECKAEFSQLNLAHMTKKNKKKLQEETKKTNISASLETVSCQTKSLSERVDTTKKKTRRQKR